MAPLMRLVASSEEETELQHSFKSLADSIQCEQSCIDLLVSYGLRLLEIPDNKEFEERSKIGRALGTMYLCLQQIQQECFLNSFFTHSVHLDKRMQELYGTGPPRIYSLHCQHTGERS